MRKIIYIMFIMVVAINATGAELERINYINVVSDEVYSTNPEVELSKSYHLSSVPKEVDEILDNSLLSYGTPYAMITKTKDGWEDPHASGSWLFVDVEKTTDQIALITKVINKVLPDQELILIYYADFNEIVIYFVPTDLDKKFHETAARKLNKYLSKNSI